MADYAPSYPKNALPTNRDNPVTERAVRNELADKIVGAAPGATAAVNRARIANTTNNAGKRKIETVTPLNRATTTGDATAIKGYAQKKRAQLAFPADKSGNGGPAFTRA